MPRPDLAQVLAEDAADGTGRLREGVARGLEFHPAMGQLYDVPGGGWLWVVDIHAVGAFGVRAHFVDFNLPEGAKAIVYDPQIPGNLPSPYTGKGLLGTGEFWAWTSWSDVARVEVYYPREVGEARFGANFKLDQAVYMYRNPATGQVGVYDARELGCHNDLACNPNWVTNGAGVGLMSFVVNGSSFGCTGSMLNDSIGDLTPYFMTARHCMQDNGGALGSLQVYWFYQQGNCGGATPSLGSLPRSDACLYVRTDSDTDMSMVLIEGTIPRTLWWSGNDSAFQNEGTPMVGIHHPRSTRKRISFGNKGDLVGCAATGLNNGFHVDYYSGTTEPGSSGSPIYLSNGAFVGVDSCGPAGGGRCPTFGYEATYGSWFVGFGAFQSFVNNPGPDDSNDAGAGNDSCASATNLNIYSNGTIYGQVVKVYDSDWFRITVPAFGDVYLHSRFMHANGDIDMALHDGCGAVLMTSASTSNDETINWHNSSSSPREVYLHAFLYNDTRNVYYLDFSRSAPTPPSNNTCSTAPVIALGTPGWELNGHVFGTTTAATVDGSASCGTSNATPDSWHRLTVACTREVTLHTYDSSYDTVLSVHTGCPGTSANQVACNDDDVQFGSTFSRLVFTAVGGQNYYVRVSGYQGAAGSYQLSWLQATSSDDLCTSPSFLNPGTYGFNNCVCESDGPSDTLCTFAGSDQIYKDFWVQYTPNCYGTIEVNTFQASGPHLDTRIAVYANPDNSTCPSGPNSAIACNDDANANLESQVVFECVAGQRYIFRIGSYAPNTGGPGTLRIIYTPATPCTPPTGACCAEGVCSVVTQAECLNQGGEWYGDGTTCEDPGVCVPVTEAACCIAGVCNMLTEEACGLQGGTFYGAGVTCDVAGLCDAPTGACCINGECSLLPAIACADQGGTYFGDNTECAANPCVPVTGACCTANQCLQMTAADCLVAEGSWQGEGTVCVAPDSCPPRCGSVDFNCDGDFGTDSDIEAYFACLGGNCPDMPCISNSDFNGDGDFGTDGDIEAFFRVLAGGNC
jgi:hypothetical protein